MAKKSEKSKLNTYEWIAQVTARVGSNADGSPKLHFIKGEAITLTLSQIKSYKNYIK